MNQLMIVSFVMFVNKQ